MKKTIIGLFIITALISSQAFGMDLLKAGSQVQFIPVPGTSRALSLAETASVGLVSWLGWKLAPEKAKEKVRNTLVGGGIAWGLWMLLSNRTAIINKIDQVNKAIARVQDGAARNHEENMAMHRDGHARMDAMQADAAAHHAANMAAHQRAQRNQTCAFIMQMYSLGVARKTAADVSAIRHDVAGMRNHMGALTNLSRATGEQTVKTREEVGGLRRDLSGMEDRLTRQIQIAAGSASVRSVR